jgi:quercetin dioxygenase-like cupin family protein
MDQTTLLDGKVVRRSLPIVKPPVGAEVPNSKRLMLPQGELAQIYDAEEGIRYMAVIELRQENTRGNHYHKVKVEWVYVTAGEVLLVVEDVETKRRESIPLRVGDLAIIRTGVAHALQVVAPGEAIEFSGARFDAADIYRYQLL